MSTFIFKAGLGFLSVGVLSEVVYQLYKRFYIGTKKDNSNKVATEVLFFPDAKVACKSHFTADYGCENTHCQFSHEENSLSKLFTYLTSARSSLDVCVFVITCSDLADLLVKACKKGVKVRVITDHEQVDVSGSQIWKLRKEGIPVRVDSTSFYMHHKFAIIDKQVLINGSFNWTRTAITGNTENILITNNKDIVKPFFEQFEQLWLEYDPTKKPQS